ncbi:MAG: enoyl-CoA hydratase/isomerase family protein [Candidatus Aminicenantes bacterium]|nr:enoyl-CoA hydratase/isomerase family protein [Candidatus Aminicenantes bacterium]
MDYKIINVDSSEQIATLTINRPEALNALNSLFFKELDLRLDEISSREDIQIVVITGEGKAFVAGADIAEMARMNPEQAKEFSRVGQAAFRKLELLEKPVIAAVNGFALGGGCELALACDIRIASSKAKFGQPEVNLGLIPGYAGTQRLPRLIGLGNALFLLFSGDTITAEQARQMGLVQQVVEPESLMPTVRELAAKIASKGPRAIKLVKQVARKGLLMDFESGCQLESREFSSLFENEGLEGMKAFLEKRAPKWQN